MSHISQERIDLLAALESNWDSYGAQAPTKKALDALKKVGVFPTANGGVQIEFHADGWDIEVEIDSDGRLDSVFVSK